MPLVSNRPRDSCTRRDARFPPYLPSRCRYQCPLLSCKHVPLRNTDAATPPLHLHTDGYTNTNRVLSSLRIALFKQASRCTFPNFIIGRRGYPCALVCAFVTSVCVHFYPHPSLSRARARARDFRSLVSMQTHSFVPWRKGNGSRRGWVKKEKEKRVKKITSSNRNSPRPCCFVIVHTVYIIHTNNISPYAGETMLLTRPLLLPCKHFHRLSFFSSSVLSTRWFFSLPWPTRMLIFTRTPDGIRYLGIILAEIDVCIFEIMQSRKEWFFFL